jgi:pimeloyl-ACP methyl ester carboxylesterase
MERHSFDGVELEYEVVGRGETVVLIHGSHIADAFLPLSTEPTLSAYNLVRYHRRGFAACSKPDAALSIAEQAQDCEALLRHLGVERAHVVGHSYGGVIALQLAVQAPELVHTLVLEEPALLAVPSGEAFFGEMAPIVEMYGAGDKEGAVRAFVQLVGRSNSEEIIDKAAPGGMDQAIADADTFFQIELPALQEWSFSGDEAKSIDAPVLFVLGQDSPPMFHEQRDLVRSWLPQTEVAIIPDACHLLQMENPAAVGEALTDFFSRHPMQ